MNDKIKLSSLSNEIDQKEFQPLNPSEIDV